LNVWVQTPGKDDAKSVTKDTGRGIWDYFWSKDSCYILYFQDQGGNENWRLHTVNMQTGETSCLTPFDNVQARLVDTNKRYSNEILIDMNKEDAKVHDVYHLEIDSGRLTMRAKNPGDISGWVPDAEMQIRGAVRVKPDGSYDFIIRDDEASEWKKVLTWDTEDNISSRPVCFSRDGKQIYLIDSHGVNAGRLVRMDVTTSEMVVLYEDPQCDVGETILHPDTHEVQAISLTKERKNWVILDKSIEADFETIRRAHEGDLFISGRDNAGHRWLIGFEIDRGPTSYYLYDKERGETLHLFDNKPALKKFTLAPIEPISFTVRDGLTVHGYITFPVDGGRKNLPLVLKVHGGPWHRDFWGYNPEAQWLANRGYVCLQVNFRGSTGYGKKFINAGDREWGRKMHYDLVDAVNWVVTNGIADPGKVAIFGGSYGGYAALVGATFTPDLFCCAVDVVGPSSLITLINSIPPYWSTMLAMFYKRIGNPETEQEFLKSRSPLYKVNDIKIPILIGQGANDPRVKVTESEQIVEAMKKKGIDYEYIVFPDEGHGFARPENRLKFYAVAEKFLAKHLGGRFEEENSRDGL
jgi:dipeptidyl aminopeptidase/acylaminoacyl peptidase